jgi:hypothetical protein
MADKKEGARRSHGSRTVGQHKKEQRAFLDSLAESANVTWACKATRVPRATVYEWREADPKFAKAWDEATELGTDALEDEAIRRGHAGVDKPVYQGGEKVGVVREYSDTLLIFMLKARRPEKFKERAQLEHRIPLIDQFMEAVSGKSRGLPKPLQR